MLDLGDGPSIAGSQFLEGDEILTAQIETKLQTNLQGIGAIHVGGSPGPWEILIGGIGGGFGRGIQGETFDILALEGTGFELVGHGEPGEEREWRKTETAGRWRRGETREERREEKGER